MQPIHFSKRDAFLYGVHHVAEPAASRQEGVLICPPFGQEYMRAHRSMRYVADELAKAGFDVLRFDYRGTGDSFGDLARVDVESWVEDTAAALDELKGLTGSERVSIVGIRLGAVLAAQIAARERGVRRAVLWDTVESGSAYLDEIRASMATASSRGTLKADNGDYYINGFCLPTALQASLADLELPDAEALSRTRLLQVVGEATPTQERVRERLGAGRRYTFANAHCPSDWNYVDDVGAILFPQPLLHEVVRWVSGGKGGSP